jgi:CheY-like chemotaxis protein
MNDVIRQQLPYLRRFARALNGRQAVADRLVAKAIEAVAAEHAQAAPQFAQAGSKSNGSGNGAPLRERLFRALVDVHVGIPGSTGDIVTLSDERILASRIRALPADAAIALLLSTLESFEREAIAFIMRLSPEVAADRLRAAHAALEAQAPTEILVIEDEPVIAMDIVGIVRQAGHRVLGIATTRDQAVALAEAKPPGLILADIQLADDSSGIGAVDDIVALLAEQRPGGPRIPVIFITAFPERLLNDERLEPSLLITKPFSDHLLRVAIAQALQMADAEASTAA